MKLYLIGLGFDTEFEENHRYLFRVAGSPREALMKVAEEVEGEFHFDSLVEVNYADGRRVEVGREPTEERLFAAFVGYYIQGEAVERHGILFAVERERAEAKRKIKELLKTMKAISPHVDGMKKIEEVDGHPIRVLPGKFTPNLFLYHNDIKEMMEG